MDYDQACLLLDIEAQLRAIAYVVLMILSSVLAFAVYFVPQPIVVIPTCVTLVITALTILLSQFKSCQILSRMAEGEWDNV